MSLDKELVNNHLKDLLAKADFLKQFKGISPEEFQRDEKLILATEHAFQTAIQNMLDIGAHILSSGNINEWSEYEEILVKLGKHKILPDNFAQKLRGAARFRNLLIHEYVQIDPLKVHEYLTKKLGDFELFARYISQWIEKQ